METNIDQLIQQAKLALSEGKFEEAKILLQNILQAQPSHYKTHTNLGALLIKLGKLEEAVISFKKAIEIKPEFAVAHYNLGVVQEKLDRFDEAEMSYKKRLACKREARFQNKLKLGVRCFGFSRSKGVNELQYRHVWTCCAIHDSI